MLRRSFLLAASGIPLSGADFRLATFSADVTPAVGAPVYTGTARSIMDRLEARGVVLYGGSLPVVFLALDWCEVRNRSYDLWRSQLAAAAGTTRDRVLLSCVHPHDAPYTDLEAQSVLDAAGSPDALCDAAFERACVARVAQAIRKAARVPVTHMGSGSAVVKEVASNRRWVRPDGTVSFSRTSATRDAAIRNQPEGLIDPQLRVLSFWNGTKPVAALHAYSTHPMSYYGQGDVSADFPGMARRRLQAEDPGTFHIYFSGASGDTMAGRYNDGNPANRDVLAGRLYDAMSAAWKGTIQAPLTQVRFRNAAMVFAPRKDRAYSLPELTRLLTAKGVARRERLDAALGVSWLRRLARRQPVDLPAVHFDEAAIVQLPAEAFVRYQLMAQEAAPDKAVLTLGYGECAPGYIPARAEIAEGYDDHYSWVDFETCEDTLRRGIVAALGSGRPRAVR